MKQIICTSERQEQIQTTYLLIEGKKIIPLGNFKNRKLTKENFKLYGIINEKVYEFSLDDFEASEYAIFNERTYKMKYIAELFHIQKKYIPQEVVDLIEMNIKEKNID